MSKKKILIFAPYGLWNVHLQLDAVVGAALKQRGAEVKALGCDALLDRCFIGGKPPNPDTCRQCMASGQNLLSSFQIPIVQMRSLLQPKDMQEARAWSEELPVEDLKSARFEGLPLGDWMACSLYSFYLTAELDLTNPDVANMYRRQLYNGVLIFRAFTRMADEFQPDHVICFNSLHSYYRLVFELARRRGLPVLVHERGNVDNTFRLFANETASHLPGRWETFAKWKDLPLDAEACAKVKAYFFDREQGKNTNFRPYFDFSTEVSEVRRHLRIPQNARVVALFGSAGREVGNVKDLIAMAFSTQEEWIRRTVALLADKDVYLIIRHHPNNTQKGLVDHAFLKSVMGLNREFGDRVRVVMPYEKINSYSILWNADLVLTFFSTLGAEAAVRNVPSLAIAASIFGPMGVELAESPEGYAAALERGLRRNERMGLADLQSAYRFAYFLYFKVNYRFSTFGIKNLYEPDIKVRGWDDLATGKDATLDHVCRHILEGTPLYPVPGKEDMQRSGDEERAFLQKELQALNQMKALARDGSGRASATDQPKISVFRAAGSGRSKFLDRAVDRARQRDLERRDIALTPEMEPQAVVQALKSAAESARGEFIYIAADNAEPDESLLSNSADVFAADKDGEVTAVAWGAWLCNPKGDITGELLTEARDAADFAEALAALPTLADPAQLLSFFVWRKSFLLEVCEYLSAFPIGSQEEISALIFDAFCSAKQASTIRKMRLPMLNLHAVALAPAGAVPQPVYAAAGAQPESASGRPAAHSEAGAGPRAPSGPSWTAGSSTVTSTLPQAESKHKYDTYSEVAHLVNTVPGWLLDGQEKFLFDKARSLPDGSVILEMGAERGRSTTAMAFGCAGTRKRIFSIDTFGGNDGMMGKAKDFQEVWKGNLARLGLDGYATPLKGYTFDILPGWSEYPKLDFVFIDASHEYLDVLKDFELVYPHVKPGGWIAFHDVEPGWPGSWRVWLEYGVPLLSDHQRVATLTCGRKRDDAPFVRPGNELGFCFARHLIDEWARDIPQLEPMLKVMRASLGFAAAAPAERERILQAEEIIGRMPDICRTAIRNMLNKDACLDGYLQHWMGITFLAEGNAEKAREKFLEAGRVSRAVPAEQTAPYLARLGGAAPAPTLLSVSASAPGTAVSAANAGHYGPDYFNWQKHIGAFGGVANLFKFRDHVKSGDAVIDFGSGGGYLLRNLPGRLKIGLEINIAARKEASLKAGIDSVERVDLLPDGCADVIVSNHALEHVHAPLHALQALRSKLKPGGTFVLVVPHEGPQQKWDAADVNKHLYTWNPMTLGNLFAAAGYEVVAVEAIQHQWPPDYVEVFQRLGEAEFHRLSREHAVRNGTYQIRIVAKRPARDMAGSLGEAAVKLGNRKVTPDPVQPAFGIVRGAPPSLDEIPVALVAYKRPEHTARVLQSLRDHNVKNLHIFCDAPKTDADAAAVERTRRLCKGVDWTRAEVHEQGANRGLAKSIMAAADSLLDRHDTMILLEDDCVPQRHFFSFMRACLGKYRDEEKVFGVSGYGVTVPEPSLTRYPYDLYFHPRIGSWGWATWKRAWAKLDRDLLHAVRAAVDQGVDLSQGGSDVPVMLGGMLQGSTKDVWTLNWLLSVYLNRGYYIYPTVSHIDNIGMDGTGVHCGVTDKYKARIADREPSRFPDLVSPDPEMSANFRKYYDL